MKMSNMKPRVFLEEEVTRCLLCHDAPCKTACIHGLHPNRTIRSLRFENLMGAAAGLPARLPCQDCETPCLEACPLGAEGRPIAIHEILCSVWKSNKPEMDPENARENSRGRDGGILSITFCGVPCETPFFLSSSVVGSTYDMVARAFESGWSGAAFKTISSYVPQEVSPRFAALRKEGLPFLGFKNIEQVSDYSLKENLSFLSRLKRDYPSKVIIASIMGDGEEDWTRLARLVTESGADIIECNFSCPHMAKDGLGSDVGQNPELVAAYTEAVKRGTCLPVLAKMTPNLGNMEIPALAAVRAGADGLAAINTVKSVMNVHLDSFSSDPDVNGYSSVGGYSGKAVKPMALRFIHDLKASRELSAIPVSGMGGIETWRDAAEFLALGCENLQVTTAVMQYGYRIIEDLADGLTRHLQSCGCHSVKDLIGRALPHLVSPEELDRSSICYPRFHREACLGCGRCFLSCRDGGHQAISWTEDGGTRRPVLDGKRCVGCHLCTLVCPAGAIEAGKRLAKV